MTIETIVTNSNIKKLFIEHGLEKKIKLIPFKKRLQIYNEKLLLTVYNYKDFD